MCSVQLAGGALAQQRPYGLLKSQDAVHVSAPFCVRGARSLCAPCCPSPYLQVEFADVLVLNKCDLVAPDTVKQLEVLLRKLNTTAKVCISWLACSVRYLRYREGNGRDGKDREGRASSEWVARKAGGAWDAVAGCGQLAGSALASGHSST